MDIDQSIKIIEQQNRKLFSATHTWLIVIAISTIALILTLTIPPIPAALITGISDITSKGEVRISPANVTPLKTTLCGLKRIEKLDKTSSYKVIIDNVRSAKSNAAKIYLKLVKGSTEVLDLEVRYKGSFNPDPQFQGGLNKEFKKLLDAETCG